MSRPSSIIKSPLSPIKSTSNSINSFSQSLSDPHENGTGSSKTKDGRQSLGGSTKTKVGTPKSLKSQANEDSLDLSRVKACEELKTSEKDAICFILQQKQISSGSLKKMTELELSEIFEGEIAGSVQLLLQSWRREERLAAKRQNLVEAVKSGDVNYMRDFFASNDASEGEWLKSKPGYCETDDELLGVNSQSLLHVASKYNQVEIAEVLLEIYGNKDREKRNELIWASNSKGENSFHTAASFGCLEMAKFLLEKTIFRCMERPTEGEARMYPLHVAASCNRSDFIQMLLLEYRCDLFTRCGKSLKSATALHIAVSHQQINCSKFLAKWRRGALQLEPNDDGDLPLHIAIRLGNADLVCALMDRFPSDVDLDTFNRSRTGRNALHEAVKSGKSLEIVKILIEQYKAKVDFRTMPLASSADSSQITSVHIATLEQNLPLLTALIVDFKAQSTIKDSKEKNTPLHLAVRLKNLDIVRFLLSEPAGAKLESRNGLGRTPLLLLAAESGDVDFAKEFISEFKPRLLAKSGDNDFDGASILHLSCFKRNFDFARFIVEQLLAAYSPVALKDLSRNGRSENALHTCARMGMRESVEFLLSEDKLLMLCEIDSFCAKDGRTALQKAVLEDNVEVAELLINHGADFNLPAEIVKNPQSNDLEFSAFLMACEHGSVKCFQLLRDKVGEGGLLDIKTAANGSNLLHAAVKGDQAEMCRFLIELAHSQNRADEYLNAQGFMGRTPLHFAAVYSRVEIAAMLLANGALVNLESGIDDFARSPLHLAAIAKSTRSELMIELLLSAGASLEAQDVKLNTALHLACLSGNYQNSKILIKFGADVRSRGFNGKTPLHNAAFWIGQLHEDSNVLIAEMLTSETQILEPESRFDFENCSFVPLNGLQAYDEKLICVQLLVYQLQDLATDWRDDDGNLAVHIAAQSGNVRVLRFLCETFGARMREAAGCNGATPYQIAALHGQVKAINLLTDLGALTNARTQEGGKTALTLAIERSSQSEEDSMLASVQFLLNNGSDFESLDNSGNRPLHVAIKSKNLPILKMLLSKHGSSSLNPDCCLNWRNGLEGASPLHLACAIDGGRLAIKFVQALIDFYQLKNGLQGVCDWLLAKTSDNLGSEEFSYGSTPFHIASFKGNHRLLNHVIGWLKTILKDRATDVLLNLFQARNQIGRTCLHVAALNGQNHCVELLLKEHCTLLQTKSRNMIKNDDITVQAMILSDMTDYAYETPLTLANKRLENLLETKEKQKEGSYFGEQFTIQEIADDFEEELFQSDDDALEEELAPFEGQALGPVVRDKLMSRTGSNPLVTPRDTPALRRSRLESRKSILHVRTSASSIKKDGNREGSAKTVTFSKLIDVKLLMREQTKIEEEEKAKEREAMKANRHLRKKLAKVVAYLMEQSNIENAEVNSQEQNNE